MNLPRIESICRFAAVCVLLLGAFGKLFAWIGGSCNGHSEGTFALLLGLGLWGASIVLPDVFSIFKLPPPKT